jgi:hypothetical protein
MKLGAFLKWGNLIIERSCFKRVAQEVCSETFLQQTGGAKSSYQIFNEITKILYIICSIFNYEAN